MLEEPSLHLQHQGQKVIIYSNQLTNSNPTYIDYDQLKSHAFVVEGITKLPPQTRQPNPQERGDDDFKSTPFPHLRLSQRAIELHCGRRFT